MKWVKAGILLKRENSTGLRNYNCIKHTIDGTQVMFLSLLSYESIKIFNFTPVFKIHHGNNIEMTDREDHSYSTQ